MMSAQITRSNFIEQLRVTFPELEETYQNEVRESGAGYYQVMISVFVPRFEEELATGSITDFLRRSAAFFERVQESGDLEVRNMIWIRIYEWLLMREPKGLSVLWPVLGKRTKAAIRDAAWRWGCNSNLPNTEKWHRLLPMIFRRLRA